MRVQIAKYECTEYIEKKNVATDSIKKLMRFRNIGFETNALGFCVDYLDSNAKVEDRWLFCVCKSCGAELYGIFQYLYNTVHTSTGLKNIKYRYLKGEAYPNEEDHEKVSKEFDEAIALVKEKEELGRQVNAGSDAEYEKVANTGKCPICGAQLSYDKGFFMPDWSLFKSISPHISPMDYHEQFQQKYGVIPFGQGVDPDNAFAKLIPARESTDRAQAKEDAIAYVKNCDLFVAANAPAKASEIKENLDSLKQYILHLIRLENSIYSLEQQLSELYYQRVCNNRSFVFSLHEPAYRIKMELEELQAAYQEALAAASAAETYQPDTVRYPNAPIVPVLGTPGLFNKKKVQAENEALTAKYQAELEAYQNECKRCDQEKARLIAETIDKAQKNAEEARARLEEAERASDDKIKALEAQSTPAKAIKELLDKEIADAEDLLKKTYAARNELYGYDIIFGKYRDVVSLSSFYEYLMSGRCSSLEGADGAYNIYENEIRMNQVIAQLDTVISSLEDIKQNQYMMYQELHKINSSLHSLNSTMNQALTSIRGIEANTTQMTEYMEHISQNSDVIAHNTAVTAYYSKVNAELTNALGFMVALK